MSQAKASVFFGREELAAQLKVRSSERKEITGCNWRFYFDIILKRGHFPVQEQKVAVAGKYRPLSRSAETKDFARLTSHPVRG